MTQTQTATDGRDQSSEPVQMRLALDSIENVDWTARVAGYDTHLVQLDRDADRGSIIRLHEIAAEHGRTVSLSDEVEITGTTVWKLEEAQ